jgi:hypothetical protein
MNIRVIQIICPIMFLFFSCTTGVKEDTDMFVADADYIQVVLFHMRQRCESCNAVERETQSLLEEEYKAEVASGKVKFVSLDFQSEGGKKAAALLRASGQTLFVVRGDSISDLTSPAFMYAGTHPEYYREALRDELDKYLK